MSFFYCFCYLIQGHRFKDCTQEVVVRAGVPFNFKAPLENPRLISERYLLIGVFYLLLIFLESTNPLPAAQTVSIADSAVSSTKKAEIKVSKKPENTGVQFV